jgi:hypothetical protein
LAAVAGAEITIGAAAPANPNTNRAALLELKRDKPDIKNNLLKIGLFLFNEILAFRGYSLCIPGRSAEVKVPSH